jgi:hypothetical protein
MTSEEAFTSWQDRRPTREDAARLPVVCERTLRRHIDRYEEAGFEALADRRLYEVSHRKAPTDEVHWQTFDLTFRVQPRHGTDQAEGGKCGPVRARSATVQRKRHS